MEKLEFKFTITKDRFKILKQDKRITDHFLQGLPCFRFKNYNFPLRICATPQISRNIFLKGNEAAVTDTYINEDSPRVIRENIYDFRKALKEYTETYFKILSVQEQLKEKIKYFI